VGRRMPAFALVDRYGWKLLPASVPNSILWRQALSERTLFQSCGPRTTLRVKTQSSPFRRQYCEAQISSEIRRNCLNGPRRRTLPQRSWGTGRYPCGRVAARLLLFSSRGPRLRQDDAGAAVSSRGSPERREGLLHHAFRDQTGVAKSGAIARLVAR